MKPELVSELVSLRLKQEDPGTCHPHPDPLPFKGEGEKGIYSTGTRQRMDIPSPL